MSDAADRGGITVTELADVDEPIGDSPETTAAFLGGALRGPLDTAVLIRSFGDFRRRFGDIWPRSTLGPSVQDFFEHGGRQLYVVRVANDARGAMLCLPASGSALVLRAVEPGSSERLRAAVDYDGIAAADEDRFNLTLQRLDPASRRVVDQEIFRRLSVSADSPHFVADRLLLSGIARVAEPWPVHRPEPTFAGGNHYVPGWVEPVQAGTDGGELSDYDLVGSRTRGTGLFALDGIDNLDLVYLPPRGRAADNGPAATLAAELYCRRRGALLIVDPQADWRSASAAVSGIRAAGYASPNAMTYFPRLRPEQDGAPGRAAGAALAGTLCRLDRRRPWSPDGDDDLRLKRALVPAVELGDVDVARLTRAGINAIVRDTAGHVRLHGDATLSRGSGTHLACGCLSVRRSCLRITGAIDRATRWSVFASADERLARRVREQVGAFLRRQYELGELQSDRYLVDCATHVAAGARERGVTLVLVFQPRGSRTPLAFSLQQSPAGCRVSNCAFAPLAADCA